MAWRCSGLSNAELIGNLFRNGLITSTRVRDAMLSVDRAHYTLPEHAYEDSPQTIGYGATISAPHMHAAACEALLSVLNPGFKVLDVGSGSGYLTHVLAELVKPGGTVVGLDHIPQLTQLARANMEKDQAGQELLKMKDGCGGVLFVTGDGGKGWIGDGGKDGYDAIHVGAAAKDLHVELIDQLKNPGKMFIPVEDVDGDQYIWLVSKDGEGIVNKTRLMGVRYVPLTDAP